MNRSVVAIKKPLFDPERAAKERASATPPMILQTHAVTETPPPLPYRSPAALEIQKHARPSIVVTMPDAQMEAKELRKKVKKKRKLYHRIRSHFRRLTKTQEILYIILTLAICGTLAGVAIFYAAR